MTEQLGKRSTFYGHASIGGVMAAKSSGHGVVICTVRLLRGAGEGRAIAARTVGHPADLD